jgi:hypothetical protein
MNNTTLDRNIDLRHKGAKAHLFSGDKEVSDLYLYKHYFAAMLHIEQLEKQLRYHGIEPVCEICGRADANHMKDLKHLEMGDAADFNEREQELFLQGTGRR